MRVSNINSNFSEARESSVQSSTEQKKVSIFAKLVDTDGKVDSNDVSYTDESKTSQKIASFLQSNSGQQWTDILSEKLQSLIDTFNVNDGSDGADDAKPVPDFESAKETSTTKSLSGFTDSDNKADNADVKANYSKFEETHSLKDISKMTDEEVKQELAEYGITLADATNMVKAKRELQNARDNRAKYDKGSDTVDGHIGTYIQGKSNYCTVLAQLDTMSDEEIQSMYEVRTDENGKKVYTVTFPSDRGTEGKSVEITEDELESGSITVMENGQPRTLKDFPKGDADVALITMAFVKRYGTDITDNGAWAFNTQNKFTAPTDKQYKDNQYLEDIQDFSQLPEHVTISSLNSDELRRKGFNVESLADTDLSWIPDKTNRSIANMSEGFTQELSDGRKACISRHGIFLSDGTCISTYHSMSVRGFDEVKQELIISGNEFNNMSEIRIPRELLKYLEMPTYANTPGVDKTPEPEL